MERDYAASGIQTINLRAGNFIDPDHNRDIMSLFLMTGIAKHTLTVAGAKDVVITYCYLPDRAQAAVMLAEKHATLARFKDVPFPGMPSPSKNCARPCKRLWAARSGSARSRGGS